MAEPASAGPIEEAGRITNLDALRGVAVFGEVFVDQRFMGVFSLLFGASVVLFADRADARGNRGGRLSLWRNLLLPGGLGVAIAALDDFAPGSAPLSMIPNTVGTIPATLGFAALIILWNMRAESLWRRRVHAVGRMALTN